MSSTAIDEFTPILPTIADDCIPKISGKLIARRNPCFNNDCMEAIAKRKGDLRHLRHEPTYSDLEHRSLKLCL